jgi:hypothetical protein
MICFDFEVNAAEKDHTSQDRVSKPEYPLK